MSMEDLGNFIRLAMHKDLSKELIANTLQGIPIHLWVNTFYGRKQDDQFESKAADDSEALNLLFDLNPTLKGLNKEVHQYSRVLIKSFDEI